MLLQRHASHRSNGSDPSKSLSAQPDRFAREYLEIARLLAAYGKTGVARRRLKLVIDRYGDSPAAEESRTLLAKLEADSPGPVRK